MRALQVLREVGGVVVAPDDLLGDEVTPGAVGERGVRRVERDQPDRLARGRIDGVADRGVDGARELPGRAVEAGVLGRVLDRAVTARDRPAMKRPDGPAIVGNVASTYGTSSSTWKLSQFCGVVASPATVRTSPRTSLRGRRRPSRRSAARSPTIRSASPSSSQSSSSPSEPWNRYSTGYASSSPGCSGAAAGRGPPSRAPSPSIRAAARARASTAARARPRPARSRAPPASRSRASRRWRRARGRRRPARARGDRDRCG